MKVYISKLEYQALHDSWDYLSELISNGAEGECLESLGKSILGLASIIDKYKYRKVKKIKSQSCQNQ